MTNDLTEPEPADLQLEAVLGALADPARLALVRALDGMVEGCASKLSEKISLGCGKSTLSHHLRVLREAGLTHTRVEGTHRWVSLRRADVDGRFPGLLAAVVAATRPDAPATVEPELVATSA